MFEVIPFAARNMMRNSAADLDRFFREDILGGMKTDITETANGFKLESELPGFKKEDIKIELGEDRLTITAERKAESEENSENGFVRRERSYGAFSRSFDVTGIDTNAISASYVDGILTLNLPKKVEVQPENRQILIK